MDGSISHVRLLCESYALDKPAHFAFCVQVIKYSIPPTPQDTFGHSFKPSSAQALKLSSSQALKLSSSQALKLSSSQALKPSSSTTMKVSVALLLAVAVTGCAASVPDYEKDFDFFGNDIDSLVVNPVLATPEANLDKCFEHCTGTLAPQCKAVTFYQGTCYFKSIHGEGTRLEGAISSGVYTDIGTAKSGYCPAKVEANIDYVDNDIGNTPGSLNDCCDACRQFKGCRAYSWSNHQSGTCWFKSKRGATTPKGGVHSALAYPPSDNNLEYDTDYVDHDIGNKPSATPEGCFDICNAFPGCYTFSWSNHNHGTCWLKASKDQAVYKPGVVSAVVKSNYPKCAPGAFHDDTDILGNNWSNKNGIRNAIDCANFCKITAGCKGYSWSTYMGGTCWLKSRAPPEFGVSTSPTTGVKSCFLVV